MSKIAVFLFDGITDYEVTFIIHLLSVDAGKEIVTVSYDNKPVKSSSGLTYKADKLVSEILDEEIEGVIISGGWCGELREELSELINKLNSQKKLIAGICGTGTVLLAKSGVLEERKYTTPIIEWTDKHREVFGKEEPFNREYFIDERVVVDKNIITAKGIAFIDFSIEICDYFNLFESEQEKVEFVNMIKE